MFRATQIAFIWACFLSLASTQTAPKVGTTFKKVQGTFWTGAEWTANCLYQDWGPLQGLPPVAVAANLYQGAQYCGACVEITASNGQKKKGIINTQCVDCPDNALDMSPELYNGLMGNAPGRPGIGKFDWIVVECGFQSKMSLITKDHASVYWFAMQIAGHNTPISSVQVQAEGSSQVLETKREDYNYFTLAGGQNLQQAKRATITVNCANGKTVTTAGVPLDGERKATTAAGNC